MTATAEDAVYVFPPDGDEDAVVPERPYRGTVNGVVEYGVFVDLGPDLSGLVHSSNLRGDYDVGDSIAVVLEDRRDNGDLSFREAPVDLKRARIEHQPLVAGPTEIGTLTESVGETVHVEARVVQITQTGGPTVFRLSDGTGGIAATAFVDAGVRAYPDIDRDEYVRVTGTVTRHEETLQIESDTVSTLRGAAREQATERIESALEASAQPPALDPLIEWDVFEVLFDDLTAVARRFRESVLLCRPVWIRHHADVDGLCASVPIRLALERLAKDYYADEEVAGHLVRRLPSKAPFYELEDSTRDLSQALDDQDRHGQRLPLVAMLDNGSTSEDTPAYQTLRHYDVPIIAVDHHHPDAEAVDPLLDIHVNPYLYGEDYRVTTGMMAVEIARLIDPDLTPRLRHLPAVAGLADRSNAEAMPAYLELAAEAGYSEATLRSIGDALDYASYWLRYNPGRRLVADILGVADELTRHETVVEWLAERARSAVSDQLSLVLPHVEEETLANGVSLYRIDVEQYARRHTYPAPGKTTGAVHDHMVEEHGAPAITIGYGPDFAVLRSDGVELDIPQMIADIDDGVTGGGVSGGGHLVVGSLNFVAGRREAVLEALVAQMTAADIDESIGSATSALK